MPVERSIAPLRVNISGPHAVPLQRRSAFAREIDKNPAQRFQFSEERGPLERSIAEDQSVARGALAIVQGKRGHNHAVFARAPGDFDIVEARTAIPERLNA